MGRTEIVRKELVKVIDTIGARSLLDIPCGDFNWMKAADLSKIERYIGADIVEPLIHSNQQNHGRHGVEFRLLNITSGPLPKVDLILCRDLLIHLSEADIWKSLKTIKESNSEYIFLSTYRNFNTNYDIITGAFRRLNLERPPYNFQGALRYIEEYNRIGAGKSLGLWRVSDLPVQ
jgi:2-polyprenyl-3-methyl-5-hydroxy-6-metoxy-1,4-benzoquinol methylase